MAKAHLLAPVEASKASKLPKLHTCTNSVPSAVMLGEDRTGLVPGHLCALQNTHNT